MKKLIDINLVNDCILKGINSANQIATTLNFSCGAILEFCKRNNIELVKQKRGGKNIIDLSGKVINGLKILKQTKNNTKSKLKNTLAQWECMCPCGKIFNAVGVDIRKGKIKTCGCRISIKSKRNWQGGKYVSKKYWRELNSNAENRKINISVSIEDLDLLFEKQNKRCALSGELLIFSGYPNIHTASLDRIDSNQPYSISNIQWVHKDIQCMKNKYNQQYFINLCKKVSKINENS